MSKVILDQRRSQLIKMGLNPDVFCQKCMEHSVSCSYHTNPSQEFQFMKIRIKEDKDETSLKTGYKNTEAVK